MIVKYRNKFYNMKTFIKFWQSKVVVVGKVDKGVKNND